MLGSCKTKFGTFRRTAWASAWTPKMCRMILDSASAALEHREEIHVYPAAQEDDLFADEPMLPPPAEAGAPVDEEQQAGSLHNLENMCDDAQQEVLGEPPRVRHRPHAKIGPGHPDYLPRTHGTHGIECDSEVSDVDGHSGYRTHTHKRLKHPYAHLHFEDIASLPKMESALLRDIARLHDGMRHPPSDALARHVRLAGGSPESVAW